MPKYVDVNDKMQRGYRYQLTQTIGGNFHPDFKPELSPKQMLFLGIFGGRYLRDCTEEFPKDWYAQAKLHPQGKPGHSPELNFFQVEASLPLSFWIKKGWIYHEDPRGWFQWYCRYFMGRRIPKEDQRQIRRWQAIRRHLGAIKKNCRQKDLSCRPKQRQVLLHWAYDSRKI